MITAGNLNHIFKTGNIVKNHLNAASDDTVESLLMEMSLSGFVYFVSIEVAYAMSDPSISATAWSLRDVFRQAITMAAATFYFEVVVTRHMAIGYSIALVGQLLQAFSRTPPKQLLRRNISPRKISPPIKSKKR